MTAFAENYYKTKLFEHATHKQMRTKILHIIIYCNAV